PATLIRRDCQASGFALESAGLPRYNQIALRPRSLVSLGVVVASALALGACAASLRPRYLVQEQALSVEVAPAQPRIDVGAIYEMRNTGIRPLTHIAVRLPSQRFNLENVTVTFDGKPGQLKYQQGNSRLVDVEFEKPWPISSDCKLKLSYDVAQGASGTSAL